jgi:hypothetical protein
MFGRGILLRAGSMGSSMSPMIIPGRASSGMVIVLARERVEWDLSSGANDDCEGLLMSAYWCA